MLANAFFPVMYMSSASVAYCVWILLTISPVPGEVNERVHAAGLLQLARLIVSFVCDDTFTLIPLFCSELLRGLDDEVLASCAMLLRPRHLPDMLPFETQLPCLEATIFIYKVPIDRQLCRQEYVSF